MKTIILSAGHGGRDPGAVGNGLRESDMNLAITLACRDYLNTHYTGHKLVLPRESDIYVSLGARKTLTANSRADLYVSMHNNAASNPAGRGFETFIYSGNVSAQTPGYQKIIHEAVWSFLRAFPTLNRGTKRFNHWVTREMPCPTVLVEYLFVTSPTDAEIAKREGVLQSLGFATAKGIAEALSLPRKQEAEPVQPPGNVWHRVIAGSYREAENAEMMRRKLSNMGIPGVFIEVRRDE